MPPPRRLWDSCVIIDYLAGRADVAKACSEIIKQAERGEIEIVVSVIATIEVAYLAGSDDQDSEARIRELFGRSYIIPAAIDVRVASLARHLVRKYRISPKIKPPDAAHLATAIQWDIQVVETTDPDLLRLDGREGDPPITIRRPHYEGPIRMPGIG
jgi:predicted nucleic acid-binding protein